MQYSVHAPSQYICRHLGKLLPTWSRPAAAVLVVLQPCSCDLSHKTPSTEDQKRTLRERFLQFGYRVAAQLQQLGHLADIFDPCTGLPLLSQPGQLRLDDVAVAQAVLGYEAVDRHGCSVILHPTWGSSVYPSTLLSSAEPGLVERVSQQTQEWQTTQGEADEQCITRLLRSSPKGQSPTLSTDAARFNQCSGYSFR